METIGATNQTMPEAVGELVANSFDARVDEEKLTIIVDVRKGILSVVDNGRGMTDTILEKAVCIAENMSLHIERGEGAKGHFGMGFKTSCSTLGGYYEIFTRPIGEDIELHVAFDIGEYSKRPSGADAWDVVIEKKPVDGTGPLADADHGTAFVISKLKDRNVTVSAILKYLGTAFQGHIKSGDAIYIVDANGKYPAKCESYSYIEGTQIEIDTSCGPNDMYQITGWLALSDQTHNDGLYGFNIYRNNQLIERWDKSWFRAHLMTSRVIGEVNLDFLDATFYKQGLQQSEVWKIVSAHMVEYLKPLVKASNSVSKKHNISKPSELKKIVSNLRQDYNEEPIHSVASEHDTDISEEKPEQKKTGINDAFSNVAKEKSLIISGGGEIVISYVEKTLGGNVKAPFDYIFEPAEDENEASELQVIVFQDHPLWKMKVDKEAIKILATSDSIYRMLVEKLEKDTFEATKIRNDWVMVRMGSAEEV